MILQITYLSIFSYSPYVLKDIGKKLYVRKIMETKNQYRTTIKFAPLFYQKRLNESTTFY